MNKCEHCGKEIERIYRLCKECCEKIDHNDGNSVSGIMFGAMCHCCGKTWCDKC